MGAGALMKQAERVEENNPSLWWGPYFEWEADAMALAYQRWVAAERPDERAAELIKTESGRLDARRGGAFIASNVERIQRRCNKMAWFELFNEYSLIGVGGHYLSLPFEEFHRLSRYTKSRSGNTAPPRLAFVLMALLGTGVRAPRGEPCLV